MSIIDLKNKLKHNFDSNIKNKTLEPFNLLEDNIYNNVRLVQKPEKKIEKKVELPENFWAIQILNITNNRDDYNLIMSNKNNKRKEIFNKIVNNFRLKKINDKLPNDISMDDNFDNDFNNSIKINLNINKNKNLNLENKNLNKKNIDNILSNENNNKKKILQLLEKKNREETRLIENKNINNVNENNFYQILYMFVKDNRLLILVILLLTLYLCLI